MEILQTPLSLTKFLTFFSLIGSLWSCGDSPTSTTNNVDAENSTETITSVEFESVNFDDLVDLGFPQKWSSDFKVYSKDATEDGLTTIENGFDFEQYLDAQKNTGKISHDYFGMLGALENVFHGATQEDIISDRNVVAQKALNDLELKCYKMRFILSLKDGYANEREAYNQIYRKLNELCNNCTLLTEQQITFFQDALNGKINWGIFGKLSTQQMVNFGI